MDLGKKTNVAICDDHELLLAGIVSLLERHSCITIAASCRSGFEALEISHRHEIDVWILDISMPEMSGIELAKSLFSLSPDCKIIFLSIHKSRHLLQKALSTGAHGYILKEDSISELFSCIKSVSEDRFYISEKMNTFIGNGDSEDCTLSEREQSIIRLLCHGQSIEDIARALFISSNTVTTHKRNIMQKLNLHSERELISFAYSEGYNLSL
ncbi:MAG: response regulator transcription factor [Deltaproteobacteria bacterium]|nr:response regulator transcription factor [Deltaproteobacteria bacterium]